VGDQVPNLDPESDLSPLPFSQPARDHRRLFQIRINLRLHTSYPGNDHCGGEGGNGFSLIKGMRMH
jgi:hypothetical protein